MKMQTVGDSDSFVARSSREEEVAPLDAPPLAARDRQFASLYGELLAIARRTLGRGARRHSIQATALVHEAYLKLRNAGDGGFLDKRGFLALAARVMRCVLVDHARRRGRLKRGAGDPGANLDDFAEVESEPGLELTDLLALDDALRCLGRADPMLERIVELRFFLGLDVMRTAQVIGLPKRTVERKWALARDALARLLP